MDQKIMPINNDLIPKYNCLDKKCMESFRIKRDLCRHLKKGHKWSLKRIESETNLKMGGWLYYPIQYLN